MMDRSGSLRARRYIKKIYSESGINTRYSVVTGYEADSPEPTLFRHSDFSVREPTTGERNAVYVEEAKRLIPEIARRTLANCPTISAHDITHVITVSCTASLIPDRTFW